MKTVLLLVLALLVTSPVFAQEALIELIRSDVRTQKIAILTMAMNLSEEDQAIFWPLQREHENELVGISDYRIKLIREYGANYTIMTEEKAAELAEKVLLVDGLRSDLKKNTYAKMAEALSSIKALRFLQVEGQIQLLIDLGIIQEVPLIYKAGDEPPQDTAVDMDMKGSGTEEKGSGM